MSNTLDTLSDWIDIESITGGEGDYGDAIARRLEAEGFGVERQELSPGRFNVLARGADPRVVFCTHLDTVPPFIGPSRKGQVVHGRGACDAKGPALAMIEAAKRLIASGEDRIGFLLTAGEEVDSAGAKLANARIAAPWRPRYTIVGEPTANEFIRGGKGLYRCTLHAKGETGHSSLPGGRSAIHELVTAIHSMLTDEWGNHEVFGQGTINFGEIEGGLAANVFAPDATASVLVRAVEDPAAVEARLRRHLTENIDFESYKSYGPIAFHVPEGREGPVVAFGTDAPYLGEWGTPLLYGPGHIEDAHTAHEKLTAESLDRAIADYEQVARELLARIDADGE